MDLPKQIYNQNEEMKSLFKSKLELFLIILNDSYSLSFFKDKRAFILPTHDKRKVFVIALAVASMIAAVTDYACVQNQRTDEVR